jgi:diamine N-acetyltransferase
MSAEVELRDTRPEDLEYILEVEAETENARYITRWPWATHLVALSDPDLSHLVVEAAGDRVGFIIGAGHATGTAVELRRIVIGPKGHGYGRAALRTWLARVTQRYEPQRIWLDVYADNVRARSLYESEGFRLVAGASKNGRRLLIMDLDSVQLASSG